MKKKKFNQRVRNDRAAKQRLTFLENAKAIATLEHDYEEALDIVNRLLKRNTRDTDALILKGNILDLAHKRSESRRCYEKVLRRDKNNVRALIDMGDWCSYKRKPGAAVSFYDRALSLLKRGVFYLSRKDEFEEGYTGKIALLRELGRMAEARQVTRDAVTNCPDFKPLRLKRDMSSGSRRLYEKARGKKD